MLGTNWQPDGLLGRDGHAPPLGADRERAGDRIDELIPGVGVLDEVASRRKGLDPDDNGVGPSQIAGGFERFPAHLLWLMALHRHKLALYREKRQRVAFSLLTKAWRVADPEGSGANRIHDNAERLSRDISLTRVNRAESRSMNPSIPALSHAAGGWH